MPALAKFNDFYLVGGTALALQIGHRLSIDFDLFTSQLLNSQLLTQVKRVVAPRSVLVTYRTAEQLNLIVDDVKVTFFQYPYPTIDLFVPYKGLNLVSVHEIAAMKAFAIGKRLAYKDYIDWYFLLHDKFVTLPVVIALAKKKFGGDFNDRLFLGQLISLEDVPTQPVTFLRQPIERTEIEQFLEYEVSKFQLL
ncbi:MAG: nucleotidyl transferase AbiEii/AbiGii toxin family protein [Patescibacteria group bacterium]